MNALALIPDSRLATAATELVRDTASELVYHHSRRVHLYGALRGRAPGLPEFMEPEVALVTAGVEYDVLGIGYDDPAAVTPEDRAAIVAAHPRPDFKRRILEAFAEGIAPRPDTTFGDVKADVLRHYVPGFTPGDFVDTIRNSAWPE
ncbi:hypothetical protein ACFXGT_12740 [Streptomyces sp. NPDC059352]|uniref:hypothetical protein n=1 Tax=Streptomyces sp. NPDC059352 TaxID=3346810 RepID=UPI0036C87719